MRTKKVLFATLLTVLICNMSCLAALTDGLVAHYSFENNTNDVSGNNYHALAYGGLGYAPGVQGQAAVFDGFNDYAVISNNSVGDLSYSGSIAFYFKAESGNFDSGQHRILEKDGNSYWMFDIGSNDLRALFRDSPTAGSPTLAVNASEPAPQSEWTSYIMVKDGNNIDLYVNGNQVFSQATVIDEVDAIYQVHFGYSGYWDNFYFKGMIDEVRFYDRALDSGEIAALSIPEPATLLLLALGGLTLKHRSH